jgi:hypothetical protein
MNGVKHKQKTKYPRDESFKQGIIQQGKKPDRKTKFDPFVHFEIIAVRSMMSLNDNSKKDEARKNKWDPRTVSSG